MVYPKDRICLGVPFKHKADDLKTPEFRVKRDAIIVEFNKMFAVYGNPTPRDTVGIEEQLFDKSHAKAEYMVMARRLVRTMLEMAQQHSELSGIPITSYYQPRSLEEIMDEISPLSILSNLACQRQPAIDTITPVTSQEVRTWSRLPNVMAVKSRSKRLAGSVAQSGRHRRPQPISYNDVPLFLLNQRYQAVADSQKVADGTESSSSVKVVTRVKDGQGHAGERSSIPASTAGTFDVCMTFQVPQGYRMKNLKVTLEINPV